MSTLVAAFMPLEKLKQIVAVLEAKEEKGFKMTISIRDESNKYGQNVDLWAEQSKEQREAKQDRFFCGNGRVTWTDGKIVKGEKPATDDGWSTPSTPAAQPAPSSPSKSDDDLPF